MNLSTAPLSQKPSSRAAGLALVAAVHVVVFIAVSQGLVIKPSPKPAESPQVRTIEEPPPLPKPVPRIEAPRPTTTLPDRNLVPDPEIVITSPAPTTGIVVDRGDPLPGDFAPRTQAPTVAPASAGDGIRSFAAVCTRTQAPEAPAVNWNGEALFSVVAGTHAGRVNQVEIRLLRGAMDGRTQRAFRSAIESAMREGYQCPGDVRFSQEFQFRVE